MDMLKRLYLRWQSEQMVGNFLSLDDAFLNTAYLSELWAVRDLVRIKKEFADCWNEDREKQLNDEARHARLLLDQLKMRSSFVVHDISYSMQERLYRKYINLGATESASAAAVVHNMTESRALWIYRTYMKLGKVEAYKKCIAEIIEDEKTHFITNASEINPADNFLAASLRAIDKALFRTILPYKYGNLIFNSIDFWQEYYVDAARVSSNEIYSEYTL